MIGYVCLLYMGILYCVYDMDGCFFLVYRRFLDFGFLVDFLLDIRFGDWEWILWYMCNIIDVL